MTSKATVALVMVGMLAGWGGIAGPAVEALRPEVALSLDEQGIIRLRCGVTPVGPAGYTARPTELNLTLRPEVGSWRIVARFSDVVSLAAGEESVLADWRMRLPPGGYTVTWGDPCEGRAVVSFLVAQDKAGRAVLVAPARFLSPLRAHTLPVADSPPWLADRAARRAAAWAQAALAEDLALCAGRVEVVQVLAREFPDASLGVREPGMIYAQRITHGYVVRLRWSGREFEYRVGGEALVRVPEVPSGRVPDEVWAVHVFAYHPGVDLLLHGDLTCSRHAVLPLARWVPGDVRPLEAALRLLLSHELAPWETEAGYISEFPLPGVALEGVTLVDGVLTVVLRDPAHRTSGGACRAAILRAQIEKTALRFPGVREVRILPPEVLQP